MHYDDIETAYTTHEYPNAECMVSDTNDVPSTNFVPPTVKMIPKRITENGTYYASQDNADGYDEVVVDVEGGDPNIEPLTDTITENGVHTYAIEEGVDGYYPVTMNVNVQPRLGESTVNYVENREYILTPPSGYDGFSKVTVNVDVEPDLENKNITANGTYTPSSGYDGFSQVNVNVQPTLEDKTVTANGTYTAGTGYDGLGEVTVNVPATEPDMFYHYVSAEDGKIVLRQKYTKVLGQYEIENRVFFNGYHLTAYDTIPANIDNYIPDVDVSSKNYTNNTSTTQNGWISIAKHTYNQIRCYNDSWSSYLSNVDIWAVVDLAGGNAQTLPWSDPYDVTQPPDITLNKAQISSINNKYMGAISTNQPIVAGYYAISFYHSDESAGDTNCSLINIDTVPKTISLSGLSNFRLNVATNSVEVDNYDGSAKDIYMSIIKIPEYAICVKPD